MVLCWNCNVWGVVWWRNPTELLTFLAYSCLSRFNLHHPYFHDNCSLFTLHVREFNFLLLIHPCDSYAHTAIFSHHQLYLLYRSKGASRKHFFPNWKNTKFLSLFEGRLYELPSVFLTRRKIYSHSCMSWSRAWRKSTNLSYLKLLFSLR